VENIEAGISNLSSCSWFISREIPCIADFSEKYRIQCIAYILVDDTKLVRLGGLMSQKMTVTLFTFNWTEDYDGVNIVHSVSF